MSMATRTDTQSPAPHAADSHDLIRVHGARVNNLKDISVEIPKRRLTVFTGVSGSGKSSLVFGTIAAESQRLINETYSAFVQGFMPTLARPDVDVLDGLTTAILVDQERMGADPRSTVGTATDANAMLRILFSRLGKPHIGSPQAFSFNVASISGAGAVTLERGGKSVKERRSFSITGGMCPRCEGRGAVTDIDLSQLYDDSKSLNEGALTIPGYTAGGWNFRLYSASGFFDPDKPISKYTKKELHDLLQHEPVRMKIAGINMTYEGLIPRVQKSMLSKDKEAMQPHIRAFVDRAVTFTTCPECGGTRLSEAARSSKIKGPCPNCNGAGVIYTDLAMMASVATTCEVCEGKRFAASVLEYHLGGRDISEVLAMPVTEAGEFFGTGEAHTPAAHAILDRLADVGLGYLSLGQPLTTLSGGERQRLKLATHMTGKGGVYVLDEPTAGLHLADVEQLLGLLDRLVDSGKSVIVIEHHQAVMAHADWIIDLGPGAGHDGGRIVFEGTPGDLVAARSTLTGEHLAAYVGT